MSAGRDWEDTIRAVVSHALSQEGCRRGWTVLNHRGHARLIIAAGAGRGRRRQVLLPIPWECDQIEPIRAAVVQVYEQFQQGIEPDACVARMPRADGSRAAEGEAGSGRGTQTGHPGRPRHRGMAAVLAPGDWDELIAAFREHKLISGEIKSSTWHRVYRAPQEPRAWCRGCGCPTAERQAAAGDPGADLGGQAGRAHPPDPDSIDRRPAALCRGGAAAGRGLGAASGSGGVRGAIACGESDHDALGGGAHPFWKELRREYEAKGEKLVPYSCRHGYAHRAHVICDLPPKVVAAAMGHSVQTHLAAYSRWCGDDVVDDAFARAEQRLGQGLRAQSSAA